MPSSTYTRTENSTQTVIPAREALAEINHAQMKGKHLVAEMSYSRGNAHIVYTNGRTVRLTEGTPETAEPAEWRGTRSRFNHLHRFNPDTGRARCNSRIRPEIYPRAEDNVPRTRPEIEGSEHGDLYTFCPHCEKK